eukprot:scaffold2174_cov132-Isochrysis_galbana.AAC.1
MEGDRGARGVRVLEGGSGSPQISARTPTPLSEPRCFAPCPVLPFAREKAPSVSVSDRPRSDARYEGSRRPFVSIPPSVLELRLVNHDLSAASLSHSCEVTQSNPSPQSGMVQPVVNEMFATVHAAGSSLLGLFTSCTTFDSTRTVQLEMKFV